MAVQVAVQGEAAPVLHQYQPMFLPPLPVDVPPSAHMLVVRNDDRPGMIGAVGTLLGDADINIAGIHVGQSAAGLGALMVLATASPVPVEVVRRLESTEGIVSVHAVDLV